MSKKNILCLSLVIWISLISINILAQRKLSTPDPSKEAIALYRYLQDMKGKKILSGQMWAPWGFDELKYLQTNTGKQPAIRGIDFIDQKDNQNELNYAIDWWKSGGIPTIMWHWGAPGIGEGYENSKKAIEIDKCFQEGTAENIAFLSELKVKADLLIQLRDAHIPILWRPFHELNGNWFWYGKQGPERFKKLWITMYNYFVKERGINNLIWVLCYTGQPDSAWYPGDEYVDIAGADTYAKNNSPQQKMYNEVKRITKDQFPIAFHECGIIPDPDQCLSQGCMWSWWMEWHTGFLAKLDKTYLKYVYDHELVVTKDEVPDIMAQYGWNDSNCKPSEITAFIKADDGEWKENNTVSVDEVRTLKCKVEIKDKGNIQWSGYGTSGASLEQSFAIKGKGTITVIFKNSCGATSSQTINLINGINTSKPAI